LFVAPVAAGLLTFSRIGCGDPSNRSETGSSRWKGDLKVSTHSGVELLPSSGIRIAGLSGVAFARVCLPLSSNDVTRPNERRDGEGGEENGYKQGRLPHAFGRV